MERETRAVVFESENATEIQIVKSRLEKEDIETFVQNSYMSFLSTPTAATLKLQVNLADEKKAFDLIDDYMKETDVDFKTDSLN